MGTAINLYNLPQAMNVDFQGFVEGWSFNAGINSLSVTLKMSPIAYSLQAYRWNSVAASVEWQDVSATLIYDDAFIVS